MNGNEHPNQAKRAHASTRVLLALALAAVAPSGAVGQVGTQQGTEGVETARARPTASQMRARTWDDRHGLPQNSVQALAQTPDGYVWLGTQEALARFDGARFTTYGRDTDSALARPYIWSLWADRDNSLWIGTEEAGLIRKRGDDYVRFDTAAGLPHLWVSDIERAANGTLWVGTMGGAARMVGNRFESFDEEDGLPHAGVTSVLDDRAGGAWVGTFGGLARIDSSGRVRTFGAGDGLPAAWVGDLDRDAAGNVLVGTPKGLYRYTGAAFEPVPGLGTTPVTEIAVQPDGTIWGTAGGMLNRLDPDGTVTKRSMDEVQGPLISELMIDREGSLWVGTYGRGATRLRATPFMPIGQAEGLASDIIYPVLEDRAGGMWIGTAGAGVNHMHEGRIDTYSVNSGHLGSDFILGLREAPDGALWVATNFGFSRIENGAATVFGPSDGIPDPYQVRDVLEARDGTIWLALPIGLQRFAPGPQRTYTAEDGLADDFILTLLEDPDGSIWIGARRGLSRMRDGRIESWGTDDGLPDGTVSALHRDRSGTLWLAGPGVGLVRMDGPGRFRAYRTADGLCDELTAGIVEDDLGYIWLSSNRGIFRVSRADLAALDAGRIETLPCHLYGREAGMRAREASAAVNPAGVRARDGRLWFPTIEGLVVIEPTRLSLDLLPPPVVIEEVVADGRIVAGDQPVVPAGTRNLEVHFTALTFIAPELVRFRYRLEGFDPDWIEAGDRRIAFYTNVPPGRYRFRVQAANAEGTWNEAGATIDLRLRSLFRQTIWFRGLILLALIGLLALAYGMRVRALKHRQSELEDLVFERSAAEARWRDLFENATDAVFTTDMDGRITAFNQTAEEMTGRSRVVVLDRHVSELVPPELRADLAWPPASGARARDLELQAGDGRSLRVELSTRVLREHDRPVAVLAVCRDVREREALEGQLRQSQKMEAVGKLAGGVAHDFNNLLTVIQGNGELLMSELDEGDPRRDDLTQILEAGNRASALTRQLLAFSRKQVDQPRVFELGALVAGVEPMLRRLIGESVAIIAFPPVQPTFVRADPAQIEQVIINLAVNARDALADGGTITIETSIIELDEQAQWAGAPPAGQYALMAVSDDGIGMDADTQVRIFEPFFTTKELGRGTGLGLSTVYGIVQNAGGHVRVSSRPGEGTTFRVYLPPAPASSADAPVDAGPAMRGGDETILLVEDEDAVRAVGARVLRRLGYQVIEARHGRDAIARAESHPGEIDLLLTDVVLPEMSGGLVAEALRSTAPGLPVLFMSGYTDDELVRTGLEKPGSAFLQKPFTAAELAAAVRNVLDRQRAAAT